MIADLLFNFHGVKYVLRTANRISSGKESVLIKAQVLFLRLTLLKAIILRH